MVGELKTAGLAAAADAIEHAHNAGVDVGPELHRLIEAVGVELAKVDPVTASMLELDRELARLALMHATTVRATVLVERRPA